MEVKLRARRVLRVLAIVIAGLMLLHFVGTVLRWQYGIASVWRYFDTNLEGTVPAFFSAVLMVLAAGLLALTAAADGEGATFRRASWLMLAAIFLFLAFDELFAMHERLNVPLRRALGASGVLGFAWVLPYGAFAVAVGALMLRLLIDLPARIRALMVASGIIYLGGALGLEMVGAYIADAAGREGLAYFAETTVEELLEMSGLALFIFALMEHLASLHVGVRFESEATASEGPAVAGGRTPSLVAFENTVPIPDAGVVVVQPQTVHQIAANQSTDGEVARSA